LNLANEEIQELIQRMGKQADSLREEVLRMIWYMRGSVSYSEAMQMSSKEREIISGIIKENLETTKKSKLPFF